MTQYFNLMGQRVTKTSPQPNPKEIVYAIGTFSQGGIDGISPIEDLEENKFEELHQNEEEHAWGSILGSLKHDQVFRE